MVLRLWDWFDRLRIIALVGVLGVILLVEGDVTARIIGTVMLVVLLVWVVVLLRRR